MRRPGNCERRVSHVADADQAELLRRLSSSTELNSWPSSDNRWSAYGQIWQGFWRRGPGFAFWHTPLVLPHFFERDDSGVILTCRRAGVWPFPVR